MEKIKKFLKEEKAQGAIEYILLAGGIIIGAAVVFSIYRRMASTHSLAIEQRANKSITCMSYNQTACQAHSSDCYWDSSSSACLPKS